MARLLYVYYRVSEARLDATVHTVRAMQAALVQAHAGLQASLLRRPEASGGDVTLMETYAGIAPAVLAEALHRALAQTMAQAGDSLPQPRHDEWFETLG